MLMETTSEESIDVAEDDDDTAADGQKRGQFNNVWKEGLTKGHKPRPKRTSEFAQMMRIKAELQKKRKINTNQINSGDL